LLFFSFTKTDLVDDLKNYRIGCFKLKWEKFIELVMETEKREFSIVKSTIALDENCKNALDTGANSLIGVSEYADVIDSRNEPEEDTVGTHYNYNLPKEVNDRSYPTIRNLTSFDLLLPCNQHDAFVSFIKLDENCMLLGSEKFNFALITVENRIRFTKLSWQPSGHLGESRNSTLVDMCLDYAQMSLYVLSKVNSTKSENDENKFTVEIFKLTRTSSPKLENHLGDFKICYSRTFISNQYDFSLKLPRSSEHNMKKKMDLKRIYNDDKYNSIVLIEHANGAVYWLSKNSCRMRRVMFLDLETGSISREPNCLAYCDKVLCLCANRRLMLIDENKTNNEHELIPNIVDVYYDKREMLIYLINSNNVYTAKMYKKQQQPDTIDSPSVAHSRLDACFTLDKSNCSNEATTSNLSVTTNKIDIDLYGYKESNMTSSKRFLYANNNSNLGRDDQSKDLIRYKLIHMNSNSSIYKRVISTEKFLFILNAVNETCRVTLIIKSLNSNINGI
jgi:hypothetical protein